VTGSAHTAGHQVATVKDTPNSPAAPFTLTSQRIGALPVINHVAARMQLPAVLRHRLPCTDVRVVTPPATLAQLVITNLVAGHQPLYALADWARAHVPALLHLSEIQAITLNDDRAGRMLGQLFHADRTSLLTELMVTVIREFDIDVSQLHNDSTSISVHGGYIGAAGGKVAGTPTPAITYGHSKDHRPDLKQLVYILTVAADGAVPVLYRLADGNTCDDPTHVPTWDDLVALTGRTDFVYVADCKLASEAAMRYIDRHDGLFVTVLPRSRKEDAQFRTWAIGNDPGFIEIIRRPGKRLGDPGQVISAVRAPWPSAEGFPIVWVHDSAKQHRDAATRHRRIAKATTAIGDLNDRLAGPRCRIKEESAVHQAAAAAIAGCCAERWVSYDVAEQTAEHFKQARAGRPGPATSYKKVTARHWKVTITIDDQQIRGDAATDGCYPLITNGRQFTDLYVVEAYHGQPHLERRHHILKGVQDAAPIWVNNIDRIDAVFCCHFIAQVIGALIERQIRNAMAAADIAKIPIYPELRGCAAPSADKVLQIFADVTRHELHDQHGNLVQTFEPQLTALQRQVLELLEVPETAYTATTG